MVRSITWNFIDPWLGTYMDYFNDWNVGTVELMGRTTQIAHHSAIWNHHSVMLQIVDHAPAASSLHPGDLARHSDP